MAKPFDSTLNSLIDARPGDWVAYLASRCGLPAGPATPLDTDVSANQQADRLFRVDAPAPFALHLELQASSRLGLPARMVRYNVAAWAANDLPVHSVLVLLRPEARASDQTGTLEVVGADGRAYLASRYAVVRVWEQSVGDFLAAGPGLAPLALLTDEADADLPAAFGRFRGRLREPDVPAMLADEVLVWASVLSGLRYDEDQIRRLYMSLDEIMELSSTYQAAVRKGEARGLDRGIAMGEERGAVETLRATVLRQAAKRFGPPPAGAEAAVRAEADRGRLDRLADRVLDATGWDDLLATP